MGGLTTAFELSAGRWRDQYSSITVYQRGWRLGGKGASSRGKNGRIEEHGLHVLLGYYHDTFRVMGECYDELDRANSDPDCPITSWSEAVRPAPTVGLTEIEDGEWTPWTMTFPTGGDLPGSRTEPRRPTPLDLALRSLRLLAAFHASTDPSSRPSVTVSGSPHPPPSSETGRWLRSIGLTALAGAVEVITRADDGLSRAWAGSRLGDMMGDSLGRIRASLEGAFDDLPDSAGIAAIVDLAISNLVGIVSDRLLVRKDGLSAINDMDYRDWLRRHGAAPATVDCAIVRGMYDLVFAFQEGDPERPAFSAGLGLELATRMLFDYDGSLFWKMEAGMGEIVFAPLFQVLESRGVEFEFFHRVDEVKAVDGSVTSVVLGKQVELRDPEQGYRPLTSHGRLPTWPAHADRDQLADSGSWLDGAESYYGERRDCAQVVLEAGRDFDVVVFAASLGMVPFVCGDLVEQNSRWRAMVENIGTVATKAFQIWLTEDEATLGWTHGAGVTLSGFAPPFDTWASMSHLIAHEEWADGEVAAIAYFCSSMNDPADLSIATDQVQADAISFLDQHVGAIWPKAVGKDGRFRWELLAGDTAATGDERMFDQYWRANIDPSDRYVQSLPGTDRYRLAPGDTGFDNLVIAGDWTDCGLNAGCLEAATRSGLLAAAAVQAMEHAK